MALLRTFFKVRTYSLYNIFRKHNFEYGSKKYWEIRYKQEKKNSYEWYLSFKQLKPILNSVFREKSTPILNIGCGNSNLSFEMYNDGYYQITNIDYSSVVVYQMTKRASNLYPSMTFVEMNALKMTFADNSFHHIIDKGTLDAIACCSAVNEYLKEVYRVLRKDGVFMCISHSGEEFRKNYFAELSWGIESKEVERSEQTENGEKLCFLYILRK